MSKRRPVEGNLKEILYFSISDLPAKTSADEKTISRIREKLLENNISLLEFDTYKGSVGVINESPKEIPLKDIFAIFDSLGLRSTYTKSEFV